MKNILFLLFAVLGSCTQLPKNDLQKENLKGNVKSVLLSEFEGIEKFGEITKGSLAYKYKYIYNDKGNLLEEQRFESDGNLSYKYLFFMMKKEIETE